MITATTQRDEIRQLIAAAGAPLTRPELFAQCKLVGDEVTLSTVLSQLVQAGEIKRAGERERDKGAPLALYAAASGGGTQKSAGRAKRKKPSKQGRATAPKPRRSAPKKRSKPLPKVQRKTATSPDLSGFRCGIFNDGSLAIRAAEGEITLTETETRAMFDYLDRVLDVEARG